MQSQDPCENCPPLLLSSLRLFIPPLRLVSAAMWQVVQRGDVQDYGMLEEFVTTVTEIVPELLSCSQRAQLILGLRARMVLELCRTEQTADQDIQQHLDRIRSLISTGEAESGDAEVELSESNFVELVESLLKDPSERETFYQDVFPVEFGPKYDTAIQMLMLEFLSRLEKLLPIPDLEQTASLLSAVPSALEKCVQFVPDPIQLRTLLQYHRKLGHLDSIRTPSSFGDFILSSLSLPPYVRVVTAPDVDSDTQSEGMNLEGMEARELLENRTKEIDVLVPADEVRRYIITEQDYGMDMESAVGEIDNQAVTVLNLLRPSHFQQLKRSKRLQMKKMCSKGKTSQKTGLANRQPSSSKVCPSPNKSCKRGPFSKTCEVCGKTFTRVTAMKRHQLTHTENLKFKCHKCEKLFSDGHNLKRHQRRVCEKELNMLDEDKNEEEIPQPSTSKPQITSLLKTPSPLEPSHQGTLDTITATNTCSVCGRFFTRTSSLVRHMSSHSKERPFRCVNCGKRFKYSYDFRKHQRELCQKMTQGDLCQDVGQNMAQQKSGLQPEKDFLATAENRAQVDSKTCCVCGKILTCTSQMERHLKSHSKARPFHCAICERSFKYKDSLKKHQEILGHEGILEDFGLSVDHQQVEVNTESCSSPLTTKENNTEPLIKAFTPAPTAKEHACTVCGKILDCASHLATHMRSHSDERPYQCVNCEQRFKYKQSLNQHQRYICKVNREESSQMVDQHQEEAASELLAVKADNPETSTSQLQLVHWCKQCGKCFDDICNLKQHQESSCKEEKVKVVFQCEKRKVVFKCDDCGKDFKGSSSLRTHKRIHNPFYCSDCGRVLPNSIAFDRHKLMQHKEIQCTMCEKTFTLLGRLREHYLHQHKFTGPYPCSQCEKTFTQLSYLVIHERVHSGEYLYQCSVCQAKFNSANSLTIHSRKHTGEKPFLCWQCGKSFKAAGELSVHMGTHSEERPFSCSQCDMSYRTKLQLNSHIEQVHEGVRYPCTICGKQFYKAVSLKRHELTHTGERPFPCSYCTKTFITANEKRLHERYHTGERPYKCQDCGKSFIQSGYLKSHRRLHTGEKPFACSFCDKSFRLSYHRLKHERTHTRKNKPHVCGECGLAFAQKKRLTEHLCTHPVN
ncbi:zinc finger protein 420-like isoform X6 [Salvelinus fontinalis]|uniref:zinc finger protein 420-like isoform X6 n=1 Tax=Salvelinus fontinalis TaxID=8038 RepID=UPI0024869680|nr:zinc finger protein 420-like isoform X6 [Salvelinus fontinalis]